MLATDRNRLSRTVETRQRHDLQVNLIELHSKLLWLAGC